jgi:chemotaxis signal transduction protein
LTFRAEGQDFATDAARIRGIVPAGEVLRLEGLPAGLAGLTNYGGATLAVIDIAARLGVKPGAERPPSKPAKGAAAPSMQKTNTPPHAVLPAVTQKLVVLDVAIGTEIGFLAERVSDVLEYHARDFRDGFLHGQGRRRRVIDFDALVTEADVRCLERGS